MKEAVQDLFDQLGNPEVAFCITTNGIVMANGKNVMGAGVAQLARDRFVGCDAVLGALINARGSTVQQFWKTPCLVAFPVKDDFRYPAKISLIQRSAVLLRNWADEHKEFKTIVLVRPGCGKGGLDYNTQVRPILIEILTDDKFLVINNV